MIALIIQYCVGSYRFVKPDLAISTLLSLVYMKEKITFKSLPHEKHYNLTTQLNVLSEIMS
jgi:hypothetical protein